MPDRSTSAPDAMGAAPVVRRALITGGGSGIGRATTRRLRRAGAAVALLDRDSSHAAVAVELGATFLRCDVADAAAVELAVAEASEVLGGEPDALVACAGVYPIVPLDAMDATDWDRTLAINLRGAFLTGRAVHRRLEKRDAPAAMVLVSSLAATHADAGEPSGAYAASKAGLLALTRQMAAEWGPQVRVNAVSPGVIRTPMLRLTDDADVAAAYLGARVPLRRLGEADEVAAAIEFLLSDAASYITGAVLAVDGGASIT